MKVWESPFIPSHLTFKKFRIHSLSDNQSNNQSNLSIYYNIPKFRILGCYKSASIELSGGYFCFLRDNIWLEDEREPGTPMNFPYHNGGSAGWTVVRPTSAQMGAQSGQAPVIAQDQSAGGSDS